MTKSDEDTPANRAPASEPRKLGRAIGIGLCLGIACGIFFGEYCQPLQTVGDAYVGLLQMTVLPYLVLALIGRLARLDPNQARKLGLTALTVLSIFWVIAIVLIVCLSTVFPTVDGASFYSPRFEQPELGTADFLTTFVPTNVFRSLSREYIPAVVIFCLFFGGGLMLVPGKERLIDLLDLATAGISRINVFLVRLAPIGLFTLSAAAAGTLRIEELSRLQAYLIVFSLACAAAAFGAMPLLVSSLTSIRYRELMSAASEPMLTAIATGKLFVVLPQIVEKCDELLAKQAEQAGEPTIPEMESTATVLVPLAYPFPHVGKILTFVFVSFAGWYAGDPLGPGETLSMAATGAVSSFASPLISIPFLLDQQKLPQDLMAMFILPGFITMRMGDVVGVMHLMALTVIVSQMMKRKVVVRWGRLFTASAIMIACLVGAGAASRIYLASTTVVYDLDQRLLSLDIPSELAEATVYESADLAPARSSPLGSTVDRLRDSRVLRVGYHPDHLPYSYINTNDELVGLDVEMMHRLATRLGARLEFVPFEYATVVDQLNEGQFDVAIGGVMIKPERMLSAGFTQPYLNATLAVVTLDHRRGEFENWDQLAQGGGFKLGAVHDDVAAAARRLSPDIEITVIDSIRSFFEGKLPELDGLVIPAEEGAAWNVLFPSHSVVIPDPIVRRPIGLVVRSSDNELQTFLDRWIDFEQADGSIEQLRAYWIEGGGTEQRSPRWSIARNLLGWGP